MTSVGKGSGDPRGFFVRGRASQSPSGPAPAGLLVHPSEPRSCRSSSRIGGQPQRSAPPQGAGNRATVVAFRVTGPTIAGRIGLLCDHATRTAPVIGEGRPLYAYAVSRPSRLPSLPEIPTAAEGGSRPGNEHLAWSLRARRHPGGGCAAVPLGGATRRAASTQRQPDCSMWMLPPIICRRSSTCGTPRGLCGRSVASHRHCRSSSHDSSDIPRHPPPERVNHDAAPAGIRFMGPDPSAPLGPASGAP